jgi:hypothetical protein
VDISLILTRIAGAVNGAALQGTTLQVTALDYMPSMPEVPMFYPYSFRAEYEQTFGGLVKLNTTWHLCVSRSDDEAAYEEATKLIGTGEGTIRDVLVAARGEPSPTPTALGGAADDIFLMGCNGPTDVNLGDVHVLVIEFQLQVIGN